MSSKEPLPPLPDEAFDGEKETVEIKHTTCEHKDVELKDNTLTCKKCHAGWQGHDVATLYEILKNR